MAAKTRDGRRPGWSTAAQEVVDRLFVYGSLRDGQTARSLIAEYIRQSEPATARGTLYALPDGYPVLAGGDTPIIGDLIYLSDLTAALPLLDAYEGANYHRDLQQVTLRNNTTVWAWIYVVANEDLLGRGVIIESGDWDAFVTEDLMT